jgi:hypothetical protein
MTTLPISSSSLRDRSPSLLRFELRTTSSAPLSVPEWYVALMRSRFDMILTLTSATTARVVAPNQINPNQCNAPMAQWLVDHDGFDGEQLQLPYAINQSGWIGIPMLVVLAVMATYTAIVLIRCIDRVHATTYGDVGKAAMGMFGRIIVEIMIHLTLVGVATVYLILAGMSNDPPSH